MDWKQWNKAIEVFEKYDVKPLLGVIPECKDPDLQIDSPKENFWEYLKNLQLKGYTLAMHGLYHQFEPGMHSEFAGLSYEIQFEKIKTGKTILLSHGIETNIFFAPAHAYDKNTIKALAANGFKYMSDGFTKKPICREGVICIPCRSYGAGKIKRKGFYTSVYHAHEWAKIEKQKAFFDLEKICKKYMEDIVDFESFILQPISNTFMNKFSEKCYTVYRRVIFPIIYMIYKNIVKPLLRKK